MKKILFALTALLMAASLAACGTPEAPADPEPAPSASEPGGASASDGAEARMTGETPEASVFAGIVEDFAVDDDGNTVLLMRRAAGSPYPRERKVALTGDTSFQFDSKSIANGSFLMVRYDGEPDENGAIYANAVSDLISEELSNYNGKLVEVAPDPENEGTGTLTLDPLEEGGMSYIFLYNADTLLNVDLGALKPGDLLNVQHSPASTRSLPPQSLAFVVSSYAAPEEGELPAPATGAPAADASAAGSSVEGALIAG